MGTFGMNLGELLQERLQAEGKQLKVSDATQNLIYDYRQIARGEMPGVKASNVSDAILNIERPTDEIIADMPIELKIKLGYIEPTPNTTNMFPKE